MRNHTEIPYLDDDDRSEVLMRLREHIQIQSGCWIWIASCNKASPVFKLRDRVIHVRTFLFKISFRRWPMGHLKTKCGDVRCVRLSHLLERTKNGGRSVHPYSSYQEKIFLGEDSDPRPKGGSESYQAQCLQVWDQYNGGVPVKPEFNKDRFWDNVHIENADSEICWVWTGEKTERGYPIFKYRQQQDGRVSMYFIEYKKRPKGFLHATCRTALCVRPTHVLSRAKSAGPLLVHQRALDVENRILIERGLKQPEVKEVVEVPC